MQRFFTITCLAFMLATAAAQPWTGNPNLLAIDDEHPSVPLRVITKPGAAIYKDANAKQKVERQPLAFSVLYVAQAPSPSTPMYQVARPTGEVLGLIAPDQVLVWRQALCLKFRQPDEGGRKPVLMFKDATTVTGLAARDDAARAAAAQSLYGTVEGLSGDYVVPDDFPVVSIEPRRATDVKRNFYLMPILAHEKVQFGEHEGRALQVSIASKNAARGPTNLQNKEFVHSANQGSDMRSARDAKVEIVYCFDLTHSMQPYIDISAELANKVSAALSDQPFLRDRTRFGLIGYRDHGPEAEGFVVKKFTPQPMPLEEFKSAMTQVSASGPTPGDVPEDMLGGVAEAIRTGFSQTEAIRVLVLIGDAPGHDDPTDPRNSSGLSVSQLRYLASDNHVWLYSIYIKDPRQEQYYAAGESQFRALADNPGTIFPGGIGTYAEIPLGADAAANQQGFSAAASQLFESIRLMFQGGSSTPVSPPSAAPPKNGEPPSTAMLVNDMFRAAIVDWIGRSKDAKAPNDITAWISDRDLINPAVPAVDTCVLLTRNELDLLSQALSTVIEAGMEGKTTGKDFFACLQSVASTAIRLPSNLGAMKELQDIHLLPDFLLGLPYDSKVLRLSNDLWSSMPATKQEKFIHDMEARINLYRIVHNAPDSWISLTDNADPDQQVTPLPLEQLP